VAVVAATVTLQPPQSIQTAVNNNPAGTTFLLSAGVYRQQSIVPKTGDSFIGSAGADLNGAAVVTGFTQSGKLWTAHLAVLAPTSLPGKCQSSSPMCNYPEDLYFDGILFSRVASSANVAANKWFLNYATGTVYLANNPTGHTIEVTTTPVAFTGYASNVTIHGLIIEKYGNLAQSGAITISSNAGADWLIESNEIRYNHGAGISAALGAEILYNYIHHNGQIGISTSGDNLLIQGNEIAYNNTDGYNYNWEAGGAKFAGTHNLVASHNYVHDNIGAGLHTDIGNYSALYEYNFTTRNMVAGILHEISFDAVIRYNTIIDDGFVPSETGMDWGAAIYNNSSSNVDVYGNTITNCMNGIVAVQYSDSSSSYVVQNFYVHDNVVTQEVGIAAGISSLVGNNDIYSSLNNRFESNSYTLPSTSALAFYWMNKKIDEKSWNNYNQD
jgi:hypothetical protein